MKIMVFEKIARYIFIFLLLTISPCITHNHDHFWIEQELSMQRPSIVRRLMNLLALPLRKEYVDNGLNTTNEHIYMYNTTHAVIVANKYALKRFIGAGTFGQVFEGVDIQTKEVVAIKVEPLDALKPHLESESMIYEILQGGDGIPEIKWHGQDGDYQVMVIEILGPSLDALMKFCRRRSNNAEALGLRTVLLLADQMISRIQFIHSKNYVHRDVKPSNFVIGTGKNRHKCYIIDFGISREYKITTDGRNIHIPCVAGKNLTGTARYASINALRGFEQSRRDDMESLGYSLVYLLRGYLPWQGLPKHRNDKILEMKNSSVPNDLCESYPQAFKDYFNHVFSLGFEDEPNYDYLRGLFRNLFDNRNYSREEAYDWDHPYIPKNITNSFIGNKTTNFK